MISLLKCHFNFQLVSSDESCLFLYLVFLCKHVWAALFSWGHFSPLLCYVSNRDIEFMIHIVVLNYYLLPLWRAQTLDFHKHNWKWKWRTVTLNSISDAVTAHNLIICRESLLLKILTQWWTSRHHRELWRYFNGPWLHHLHCIYIAFLFYLCSVSFIMH